MDVKSYIANVKVVPVVKLNDVKSTIPVMEALIAGGIPVAEITFRTACAAEAIALASRELGDKMLIGAGTVINRAQAELAIKSGARFIVSPGYSVAVNEVCHKAGVLYVPGTVTPTEIMAAIDGGNDILKFFPASAYGGVQTLKSFASPFGGIKFIPTGGVSAANLADYLKLKNVLACGGSWMVAGDIVDGGNYAEITKLSAEAAAIAGSVVK